MSHKPRVPLAQRRGTSAEAEVKALLSFFSVPAKQDPDIGTDFLCELLEGDIPSGRFFGVQAKGTKRLGERQLVSIKKTTIRHWLQSPFPIFLIVFDEDRKRYHWVSITDNFWALIQKLETDSRSISIQVDGSHLLSKDETKKFVAKVNDDAAMLSLVYGHPQFGDGYVRTLPVAFLPSTVRMGLEENIRTSMNFLINHWLLEDKIDKAYLLCEFLTRFDKAHYDHFWKFGHINRLMGRKAEAKRFFEEAIRICREDKNWNKLKRSSDPSIEEIIKTIQDEIDRLNID